MRKVIIAIIATIFLIAPFEKAQGQAFIYPDFPTTNIHTGVNTRLSLGIWRFEPFVELGFYFQVFEERMTMESTWVDWSGIPHFWRDEFYSQRFAPMDIFNIGIKFRITDRDRIVFGSRENGLRLLSRGVFATWEYVYLGYMRRESLSERMNIELSVLFSPETSALWHPTVTRSSSAVTFGVKLRYEIFNNFNLAMRLMYLRRFNVSLPDDLVVVSPNNTFTQNIVDFSIGIHYHIQFGSQQPQQIAQRPPRQRVSPHQRALPCPPGQMRHLRSWDRPSSVFNHPTRQ